MHALKNFGVASRAKASGVGSVSHEIKDDDVNLFYLKIDRVLHLEKLSSRFVSPQQTLRQSNNIHDGLHVPANYAHLQCHGCKICSHYNQSASLPTTCAESGIETLCNLVHDKETTLTNVQRQLS